MTAQNHALTGAIIGLTVANPFLALPLAFLSHFVCDAIPHYDPPETEQQRYLTKRFVYEFLVLGAGLCTLIVLALFLGHPKHWLTAAICAFLATSPDLFWISRFLYARRTGNDKPFTNWFLRLHDRIQWRTSPRLIWLEIVWFCVFGAMLLRNL